MTEPTPSRDLAALIGAHWRELLGVETVAPGDDFLAVGGNSMLATMLANRIEDELGVRPPVVELFATFEQVVAMTAVMLDAQGPGR
jgi:hypothetical protein